MLRSLPRERQGNSQVSHKESAHEEMLLSHPSSLLAQMQCRVLSHRLLLLASFRTFQLPSLPLHKTSYGYSHLTVQFPEQVHLDLFCQRGKWVKSSISFWRAIWLHVKKVHRRTNLTKICFHQCDQTLHLTYMSM